MPQFPRAQTGEEAGAGFSERLRAPEAPALRPPGLSIKVTWVPLPARAPPPAASRLPAPAPSPPAPGPARYNYSPLIRPGPGKRLPRGGQAFGFRLRQPLPTAPPATPPLPPAPAELLGHQPGLSPPAGQGSQVTSEPLFLPRLAASPRQKSHIRFLPPGNMGSPPRASSAPHRDLKTLADFSLGLSLLIRVGRWLDKPCSRNPCSRLSPACAVWLGHAGDSRRGSPSLEKQGRPGSTLSAPCSQG